MPTMIRTRTDNPDNADRSEHQQEPTTLQPARPTQIVPDDEAQARAQQIVDRPSGSSVLHKCTQSHMAFLTATGFQQHVHEYHDHASSVVCQASSTQVHKKLKTSARTVQQMLNPEYLLINTPQLKKHHVRTPKFGLFLVLNCRPFKPLLNYQHGRFWG